MEKVVRVFHSFEEADAADREYYRSLTGQEKLDLMVDFLAAFREPEDESCERLARVYRVTQLERR